jgi:hypothetical protein
MDDHDQRFKVLLREFFVEFLRLFFPQWAARFDFSRIDWLDKEVFPDPPRGERRSLGLVARLPTRQALSVPRGEPAAAWLALVHVEVESADKVAPLRPRMLEYYEQLRRLYRLAVLPIGLYLRVGLDGLGWDVHEEYFWEHRVLHFEYAYIGLPALDAEQYVAGDNWLGVALAVLMRVAPERRAALAREALRRLVQCPENEYRRHLLCECVDAYVPLNEEERQEYQTQLLSDPDPGVRTMATTLFERGRQEGKREFLLLLLEERFGPLSARVREHLESLPVERLPDLGRGIINGQTLRELGLEE